MDWRVGRDILTPFCERFGDEESKEKLDCESEFREGLMDGRVGGGD